MSSNDLKAFVSSTYEDLKAHRNHVITELRKAGIFVDPMEDWTSSTDEPKKFSRDRIKDCDLCILLIGFRRGHIPEGEEESITQLEYYAAINDGIDVLAYMLDEEAPWPRKFDELDKDLKMRPWRNMLKKHHGVEFFDHTPESIAIAPALTRWMSKKPRSSSPSAVISTTSYLKWIEDRCGQMDLQKLASQPIIMGLPELFVPLYADDPEREKENREMSQQYREVIENKNIAPVDIEELVQRNSYLLIEGDPGCGKTTLLKQIALKMKRKEGADDFFLPILVFLRDCITSFKENGNLIHSAEEILEAYFHHHSDIISCTTVKEYCRRKKVIFLIDGLDEVPEEARGGIVEAFADFRVKHDIKMILAGRRHGIIGAAMQRFGKNHVKVLPFNDDQINQFIKKWCAHIFIKRPDEGRKTTEDLLHETRTHDAVKTLIENPLMLTTVCILYYEGERLPEQRAELYRKFVENLIHRRFSEPDRILEVLKGFAFKMQESGKKGIDRCDAVAIVKKSFSQKKEESEQDYKRRIDMLFDDFEPRCGLLRLEEGHYRFWHLTFQEYLAAEYLIAGSNDLVKAIEPFITREQYRETVRLYIGCLSLNQKTVAATIIRNVLQRKDASFDELVLVGEAFADIKSERRDDQLKREVQQRYWEVINMGAVNRRKKAALGELIGWIGDERDLCEFIEIKGGNYNLEEFGKQNIKPFKIGKYPVSNQWYNEFVYAKGYQNRDFWSEDGWKWKEKESLLMPRYWNDRKWNCPNLPVVGVSAYEADAFTRWLNICKFLGNASYRLPSEMEWQAAASGIEKRAYPWGNTFDNEKCNCWEGEEKIEKTSSIGIFATGNTPEGVSDFAGNVWEWTSSLMGSGRVLRGGSWFNDARHCRCACRRGGVPGGRDGGVGFRVVFVP